MAQLSKLTDRARVQEVIDEALQPGSKLLDGFAPSSSYFILTPSGELVDTKPVLSLAYERQFGEKLPVTAFRGGLRVAVRKLEKLGFKVVTRAGHRPPKVGDSFRNRTSIQTAFGGDKVGGIVCFPGEDTVNVFSDATGPYTDDRSSAVHSFCYRGAGLQGDQSLTYAANRRLESARLASQGVRFWHKPEGEPFTFVTWVAVIDRGWARGRDQSGRKRLEIEWVLQPVSSPFRDDWPEQVRASISEASQLLASEPELLDMSPNPTYRELYQGVADREGAEVTSRPRQDHTRSTRARRAVLLRSEGRCEGPDCTGVPNEPNRLGEPILDVDHIVDLALGGADNPLNMIAMCPNCHAVKTRGKPSTSRVKRLLSVARTAHHRALNGIPSPDVAQEETQSA